MSRGRSKPAPAAAPDGDARVDDVVASFVGVPGVTHMRMMASLGLRVRAGFFALFRGGELVLRLPRPRVAALVAAGIGRPFRRGDDGPPMRDWIVIPRSHRDWVSLAREAHTERNRPPTPTATRRNAGRKPIRSKT